MIRARLIRIALCTLVLVTSYLGTVALYLGQEREPQEARLLSGEQAQVVDAFFRRTK